MSDPEPQQADEQEPQQQRKAPISMHEGVEVWEDCCVCEAEPYWLEAMEQDTDEA